MLLIYFKPSFYRDGFFVECVDSFQKDKWCDKAIEKSGYFDLIYVGF